MKIVFAGSLLPHRIGAAYCSSELVVGLARRGHQVRAIAPIAPEKPDQSNLPKDRGKETESTDAESVDWEPADDLVSTAASFDCDVHPGVAVSRYPMPYYDSIITPPTEDIRRYQKTHIWNALRQAIADDVPDIVVIGRESSAPGIPEIASESGIPSVVTSHGAILAPRSSDYPQDWATEVLEGLQEASLVVCCANHLEDRLREFGVSRLRSIPNGIDTERFSPGSAVPDLVQKLRIAPGDVVVCHVSNLAPVKRPWDIVAAAAIALEENPNLVFVIVGDGTERSKMESLCEAKGVREKFRFVGWTPYSAIPEFLRLSDMLVVPSESEGLARVYLEAQASGLLLVASDIAGAREVIEDGVTGILFRKGDPEDLARELLVAARDPDMRRQIGHQARKQVEERYSMDQWFQKHEAVFEEVRTACK